MEKTYNLWDKLSSSICDTIQLLPPCPWPGKVLGVKPHADGSTITVLLQDKEVESLQLLKDDKWVGVSIIRDALTINVGDQIEKMTLTKDHLENE
nr:non-heme dioxygenase N-terminal domain-containing protein [Tanacetum cinerariifolium]